MSSFTSTEVNNLRLHVMPTKQFKTTAISLYIGIPLAEETVTGTALNVHVWRRGNSLYPETKAFRERLDDLYGAGFSFDVSKRGDYQIINIRMDVVNDSFINDQGTSLLNEVLQFLSATVFSSALENGGFRASYVQSEKETLRKKIESVINDKLRYAAERCIEEMCKDEPYRLHPFGNVKDLDRYDALSLYEEYEKLLDRASIDLYIVGDTTLEETLPMVEKLFQNSRTETIAYQPIGKKRWQPQEREVIDQLDVSQGKLNMGLRANVVYADDAYPAALVYNGILGGFAHSKLFVNVREKESLAYYASSRYDGHKGILMIQTGIEISNKDKAETIIREQLEHMKQGQIDEDEMMKTKALIINRLLEMDDSAFDQIGYHFNSVFSNHLRTREELIESIRQVDLSNVVEVANGVQLDTVYFLRDRQGGASS